MRVRLRTKRSCWQTLFFKQVVDDFLPPERDEIYRPLSILFDVSAFKWPVPCAEIHAFVPVAFSLNDRSCAEQASLDDPI